MTSKDYITRCDFNNNSRPFCDWVQPCEGDQSDWIRSKHATPTPGTGPDGDYPGGNGYFIYQEASNLIPFDTIRLESPSLSVLGDVCVEFWYHMHGSEDLNGLKVLVKEYLREYEVIFEAVRGLTEYGDTAIDNVAVRQGPCSFSTIGPTEPNIPPFTDGVTENPSPATDSLTNSSTAAEPSTVTETVTKSLTTVKTSTFTNAAIIISTEEQPSAVPVTDANTTVESSTVTDTITDILTTLKSSTATVTDTVNDANTAEASTVTETVNESFQTEKPLPATDTVTHTSTAVESSNVTDIFTTLKSSTNTDDTTDPNKTGEPSTAAGVTTNIFTTVKPPTIPATDANTAVDSSTGTGSVTEIFTTGQISTGTDIVTDTFTTLKTLNATDSATEAPSTATDVTHLISTGESSTVTGIVTETSTTVNPSTVAGTITQAQPSTVTDDVTQTIPTEDLSTATSTVVTSNQPTDKITGPINCTLDCTFDTDFCEWKQSATDNFDWTRNRGSTPSFNTGPSYDHTTGGGYYIYVEGNDGSNQDVAQLVGHQCTGSGHYCLRFWYHMYGAAHSMGLKVYILKGETPVQLWSETGNKGNRWYPAEVDFYASGHFKVMLEGIKGNDFRSDVAVDDVAFVPGTCSEESCGVSGDPHYYTFDKQVHHFMGTCTYTLSMLCEPNSALPYFNVEAANEHRGGNTHASYVKRVIVHVYDHRITLGKHRAVKMNGVDMILPVKVSSEVHVGISGQYVMVTTSFGLKVRFDGNHRVEVTLPSNYRGKVCGMCGNYNKDPTDDFLNPDGGMEADSVDGVWVTLPVTLAGGLLKVSRSGRYVSLETDFRMTVSYDTHHSVEVKLPTTYFNMTCGMCGNFNNLRNDEFMMPDGQQAGTTNQLGNSWKVNDTDPNCKDPKPPEHCPEEEENRYKSDEYCGLINSKEGPFRSCHSVVNPDTFFDSCIFDLCVLNGVSQILCNTLEAYADACQSVGVIFPPWRNSTFCRLEDPLDLQEISKSCFLDPVLTLGSAKLSINGVQVSLPLDHSPGLKISIIGRYVVVETYFGLQLHFDGDHELFVHVNERYKKQLCGLCGTYSGNQLDDFQRPDGVLAENSNDFGNSWRVMDNDWVCDPIVPVPPQCDPIFGYEAEKHCKIIMAVGGPFEDCHWYIPPQLYFESCVYDQCATGGNSEIFCNALGSYAAACQQTGVSLGDWWKDTACDSVCSASGDPHYNTFDHRVHHFMGTCTYTLSKLCNDSLGLPFFEVTTTNEHRGANTKVSYVNSVYVDVHNNKISLLKNKNVNVNGRRVNLPVSIGNWIVIRNTGAYVQMETDFGLFVRFDGNHYVDVSLAPEYRGLLCGLCGNYNGDSNDDIIKPDGSFAKNSNELGDSWRVPDNDTKCSGTVAPPECEPKVETEASEMTACGMITNPTGIFKDCHAKVNPQNFFDNCLYDMCASGGQSVSLCFAIQSYADRCTQAGICIEWRNTTFCPISCPGSSQYKSCGTRCPATCTDPSASTSCNLLPVEGCFCNEGYVLSGDKCVPKSKCGCMDANKNYYLLGESWYTHNNCSERCTCNSNNNITCTDWECGVLEKCKIEDGILGCQATGRASCHIAGDPHYFTFDKVMHTFMGACAYTLVQVCNSSNTIPLTIIGKNEERGPTLATYLKEVYIDVYNTQIVLQKNKRILMNREAVNSPVQNRVRGITILNNGIYTIVETDFGMKVKFDGTHHLEISLPDSYFSKVCGMCGNYNGKQDDELLMLGGQMAHNVTQFGNSWKAESDSNPGCLPDTREELGPPCATGAKPVIEAQCQELLSNTFKPCHHLVRPDLFIQSCIYDMCKYDGMLSTLCNIIQAYADACKSEGANFKWRNSTFCPLPCPPNSHYTDCTPSCQSTCNDIYAVSTCEKSSFCMEGCVCDEGHVLSNDECVPLDECGCRDESDNYYKVGFAKCSITGDPHYLTFDGLMHHFQGEKTYTLVQTSDTISENLQQFTIVGKNAHLVEKHGFTYLKEIRINVYNHSIQFKQKKKLVLDGIKIDPPVQPQEGLRIYQRATRINLKTDFGLSVSFDGQENSDITVPNTYKKKIGGLCGNFDGKYKNDFTKPDGTRVKDVNEFGESWDVNKNKAAFRHRRDITTDEDFEDEELITGFFTACSTAQLQIMNSTNYCAAVVDPQEMKCPPNSQYTSCMSACPASCSNLAAPSECESSCLEGCECLPGFVLSGFDCVPYKECGCSYLNNYYKVNEHFMTDDCSQSCICTQSSTVSCQRTQCTPEESCTIFSFTRGCFQAGPCLQNPCENGGVCVPLTVAANNSQNFYCECPETHVGTYCETEKPTDPAGPCLQNPCENGGVCVPLTVAANNSQNFYCECPETHVGTYCETEKPTDPGTNMVIVIAVVVVVGIVLVVIVISSLLWIYKLRNNMKNQSRRDSQIIFPTLQESPPSRSSYPDLTQLSEVPEYGSATNPAFVKEHKY
ncbi:zonadhesin-like [Latimeria chalumnae]|uniref:zonadhesin-like n=1 Tax=Latimeria chalumnae TaxID=7897 RepID=UPI00313D1728